MMFFFFFSSRRRHTRCKCDWSSDVCSSDLGWKPRGRDTRTEKPVFYAELYHLVIPTAGIIEGVHDVQVRPAQGQLSEVAFQIPLPLTIKIGRASCREGV